jgi:hypothetical protein
MTDQPQQPTEEQIRAYEAQLEEQMRQLRVEDVVVQTIVTLVNLGGRRAGLAPGTEGERDPNQLALAIEAARRLLPLLEEQLGPDGKAIRDAISQLQMAYVQLTGGQPGEGAAAEGAEGEQQPPAGGQGQPGPAQSSGRLWVPGQ